MAYLNPGMQFGAWPAAGAAGALSLAGPIGLYASRNIATGLVGLFAIWRRTKDAVMVVLLLRLFTDLFDAINALAGGAGIGGAAFAIILFIIDAVAVWFLWRQHQA